MTNELESQRQASTLLQESSNEVESNKNLLERKLKEKEWELKDTIALKDAKYL